MNLSIGIQLPAEGVSQHKGELYLNTRLQPVLWLVIMRGTNTGKPDLTSGTRNREPGNSVACESLV